ncbi:MAG TPA: NAD(P)-dependent oxidoreductase [Candidatus Sulfotelmatobacter sp.]|jgi:3-hydroxyisobutyrate dehydrogenase-like beta-hydroxyacid dehydrogenase|nr:NAD(P)-dependent oxidoreductase [Candidatus Sulfotelmatobacter sp.]
MKIAFIGLGRMGMGMARNLVRGGHEVSVYNRSHEKAEALSREGARLASSPAVASRGVDVVMTMVSDDRAVEEIVFGNEGIASGMKEDCIHVSHSTISVALARRLTAEHAERRQGYLSVPVFGRPDAADSKNLLIVAAGPSKYVERCRPLFSAIGRQTFIVGTEPWQANVAKVCGNFMIAAAIESLAESYATLRKANVEPESFLEIMNALFGSPVIAGYGRIIAREEFDPAGFALKLGLKDVRLALAAAEECAAPMPLASLVHDHLLSALAQGQGELDWSSMAQVVARNAGLPAKQ